MAKQPTKKAAVPVAAATSSPPPATSPAGPVEDASEGAASSNGASDKTATVAGDSAPAGGGQADGVVAAGMTVSAFEQAHAEIREEIERTGEPLSLTGQVQFVGVDLAGGPDRTGLIIQTPEAVFYFDDLAEVLHFGDDQVLTLGEFFDLPKAHQADIIAMLVDAADRTYVASGEAYQAGALDAASKAVALPTDQDLLRDLDLIEAVPADHPDAPDGFVWIEGKSRDGQPFRRAGISWDGNFQTHLVSEEDAFVICNDPHLISRF